MQGNPSTVQSEFEEELRAFDRLNAGVPPGSVVFYGSSSIRLWETLAEDFSPVRTVNRGFGGSTLAECVSVFERVVVPCQPRALLVYAGDNDLDRGHLPEMVLGSFSALVAKAKAALPPAWLAFISIKPSPCRWHNRARICRTNELIAQYSAGIDGVCFIDVFAQMLGPDGNPKRELFQEDQLHLSRAGYEVLIPAIRERLRAAEPVAPVP